MNTLTVTSADPFEVIKAIVLDSVASPKTKTLYSHALDEFLGWYSQQSTPLCKATVNAWRSQLESRGLAPASINVRIAAIRKLATEAADNGLLAPEIAAGILRVKGAKRLGTRIGNWLSGGQAQDLLESPDATTVKGTRDRAMLALMLGAGLRRSEIAGLTVEHIQQREARWMIVDMIGKHGRVRSVPIASWIKASIDQWLKAAGITSGAIFRAVNKADHVTGDGMTAQAVYNALQIYAGRLGVDLAPHDCRRTFAQLARKANASIEQIQMSLGHASVQTTERYLGIRQDLTDSPSDRLPLRLGVA
jgi:integrase/recombinase XerD